MSVKKRLQETMRKLGKIALLSTGGGIAIFFSCYFAIWRMGYTLTDLLFIPGSGVAIGVMFGLAFVFGVSVISRIYYIATGKSLIDDVL